MDLGLTGVDLVLCWLTRRIQPLQHRTRLMCQYNPEDRKDDLRTCEDNLPEDALPARMRKLVSFTEKKKKKKDKIQDKNLEGSQGEASAQKLSFEERAVVSHPMYEKDTDPKVQSCFLSFLRLRIFPLSGNINLFSCLSALRVGLFRSRPG